MSSSCEPTYADSEDADSSGQETEVSNEEADDPDDGQFDVDELEGLTRSGQ